MKRISAKPLVFPVETSAFEDFFADMQNFRQIMPEQVEDWSANQESCTFFIKNLGKLGMMKGSNENDSYLFPSDEKSRLKFTLVFSFSPLAGNGYEGKFELLADMNPMVEMMAKRPLTNFVNILSENLKSLCTK
jgi:hypothetical protein